MTKHNGNQFSTDLTAMRLKYWPRAKVKNTHCKDTHLCNRPSVTRPCGLFSLLACLSLLINSLRNRAATTFLQRTRFCEVLLSCAHVVPMAFPFASVLLHQVCFGLPTFRFSCGFQSRACLVTFESYLELPA